MRAGIDTELDFASYYHGGGDPDQTCERLYLWHQALCSRPVEGVGPFEIEVTYDYAYGLRTHTADGATFRLGSDGIIPTWSTSGWTSRFTPDLVTEVEADTDDFFRIASTIGGYVLFPRNGEGQRGHTINQARGVHRQIADRFDLTLECIRRHYLDPRLESPLADRLNYYRDFFALFRDFNTYVRFFLLDDLLTPDRDGVVSLLTGGVVTDFPVPAYASTPMEYATFRVNSIAFVRARNERIQRLEL
ncbi:DUF6994 family protein [Ornithinimicrobium cerasi]|uniref:Uncharacterized protein n=1 Tax=Ornithinimicrobium cerasi TaxID=2248773 RepID=A0A285VEY8_9MICO|nr:hypothetical protein [Ornithinimicrobium cerasi]SOC51081.1 hypothetical protein SAMN05421879_10115 [Ornithinimicrobium cerasi]